MYPEGLVTALVTPFRKSKIDWVSLKRLVRSQLDAGVQGFVINGTTAESPTLSEDEVIKIFQYVRKISDHSVPLVLGTGSNSTQKAMLKAKQAQKLKPDALLVVVPYYNKPPQRGLIEHFTSVAGATKLPVLLYNVPGRTVVSMETGTVAKLARIPNIIGIKEASGDMKSLEKLKLFVPKKFLLTSGDDGTAIDFNFRGGRGVISVLSHLIPREMLDALQRAWDGDKLAHQAYKKYSRLNRLLGVESNPIPVKMGLYLQGIIESPELRLPLVELSSPYKKELKAELKKLGALS